MNVFYIAYSRLPSRAANSVHVMKMCAALAENGCHTELVAAKPTKENKPNEETFSFYGVKSDFTLTRFAWPEIPLFGIIFSIRILMQYLLSEARKQKHIVYGRYLLGVYLVSFFAPTVVFELHENVAETSPAYQRVFKKLVTKKNVKRVVVISDKLKELIAAAYPETTEKLFVLHDASDTFTISEKTKIATHSETNFNVGYVGHLYTGRGVELLLAIARKNPNVMFHFIGGTDEDVLRWREVAVGEQNVHFYGFVPPGVAHTYRNSMDALVAPYQRVLGINGSNFNTANWMSPLKIFEYMAAKKPIICSDLPVLREILNEKNAMLCDPEDIDAWDSTIKKLQTDRALGNNLAARAHQDFLENYTWPKRAKLAITGLDYPE